MQDLKSLRKNWDLWQKNKEEQMISSTLQERIKQFLELYRLFTPSLKQTEPLFRSKREAYLTELQRRLQRLSEWQKKHGKSISEYP